MTLGELAIAFSDVVIDGVVVECSRGEDQATAGSLQSICWGSQARHPPCFTCGFSAKGCHGAIFTKLQSRMSHVLISGTSDAERTTSFIVAGVALTGLGEQPMRTQQSTGPVNIALTIQTTSTARDVQAIGVLSSAYTSGWLIARMGARPVLGLMAFFPLLMCFTAGLIREQRQPHSMATQHDTQPPVSGRPLGQQDMASGALVRVAEPVVCAAPHRGQI